MNARSTPRKKLCGYCGEPVTTESNVEWTATALPGKPRAVWHLVKCIDADKECWPETRKSMGDAVRTQTVMLAIVLKRGADRVLYLGGYKPPRRHETAACGHEHADGIVLKFECSAKCGVTHVWIGCGACFDAGSARPSDCGFGCEISREPYEWVRKEIAREKRRESRAVAGGAL